MGANTFFVEAEGDTAKTAFSRAREDAQYEYGHRGYTGTIAEKDSFVMMSHEPVSTIAEAKALARSLIDSRDGRIDDKWGPAGCVKLSGGKWLFFGWASS